MGGASSLIMQKVSIIIRTKNEEVGLTNCLTAISEQTFPYHEIVVVDSGSTDNTLTIAREYKCNIIEIPQEAFTFGHALNVGAELASGNILVSISAHCLPQNKNWLSFLVSKFKDLPNLAAVYGRQIPFNFASPFEARGLAEAYPPLNNKFKITDNNLFSNANCAFLKSVWQQEHFNEKLSGAEDIAWATSVRRRGLVIGYEARASVFHSHKESIADAYRRSKREAHALSSIKSEFIKSHGMVGLLLRFVRASYMDYLFLFKNPHSISYLLRWTFLIPFYRMGIYYGQKKGSTIYPS